MEAIIALKSLHMQMQMHQWIYFLEGTLAGVEGADLHLPLAYLNRREICNMHVQRYTRLRRTANNLWMQRPHRVTEKALRLRRHNKAKRWRDDGWEFTLHRAALSHSCCAVEHQSCNAVIYCCVRLLSQRQSKRARVCVRNAARVPRLN